MTLSDDDPMPFGKHKGQPMKSIPASYLLWLYEQPWIKDWKDVHAYLRQNEDLLLAEKQIEDPGDAEGFASYDEYKQYRGF